MLVIALTGCASSSSTGSPSLESPTPAEQKAKATDDVDVDELVVRRDGDSFSVVRGPWHRPRGAGRHVPCATIVGGIDLCYGGDVYDPLVRWTANQGTEWSQVPADLKELLPWPADSLAPDTFVVVGGGDGATVFPFQRVVRSTDGGATWTTYDVPFIQGERLYTTGHVVLSDGRLLVMVGNRSGDRPGRPSPGHHGLYISDRDDLTRYRPVDPAFDPPLPESRAGWPTIQTLRASSAPDPVLWVTTAAHRIYVSTDDARSFREIPIP